MKLWNHRAVAEDEGRPLAILHALLAMGLLDLPFADRYFARAGALLPGLLPRTRFEELRAAERRLPGVVADLGGAAERADWPRVQFLAGEADRIRRMLGEDGALLEIARKMYEPSKIRFDAEALGLTGAIAQPVAALEHARDSALRQLEELAALDPEEGTFYRSRAQSLRSLVIAANGDVSSVAPPETLRAEVRRSIGRGDFTRVRELAGRLASSGRAGRMIVPPPVASRVKRLAEAIPASAVGEAERFGLSPARLPARPDLETYLACACAERAVLGDSPVGKGRGRATSCTCGHACPPGVGAILKENLDLLMGRRFATSLGTRYLPFFGEEAVLVETFPETGSDGSTPLLELLGLQRRRKVPRTTIEAALRTHGAEVCKALGLDPVEFVVACVPFDAYLRLAAENEWGRQPVWSHLDGYQITRDLRLWALTGGHERYGGAENFGGVGQEYDSDRLVARFAVLRRDRFLVRSAPPAVTAG